MRQIAVVGCGFVGSIFTTEFLKRMYAGKLQGAFRFIDDDTVETRNSANQNFLPCDAGKPKAEVLADLAERCGKPAMAVVGRLAEENAFQLLEDATLIVDGVDNLVTRQLLWSVGMALEVPVLHLGIAEDGTGKVEWSHPRHDTFSLAPQHTAGKTIRDPESGVTPPCQLARMRGVGLNVGFAAAMAAAIYCGFDPESHLDGQDSRHTLTEWAASPMGHRPIPETWETIA